MMGSMDQRVPWNQFNSEAKVGHAGVPHVTVVGYASGLAINAPAPALSPAPLGNGNPGAYRVIQGILWHACRGTCLARAPVGGAGGESGAPFVF